MVFSSALFLFLFLPLVLGLYHLLPRALRNVFLLGASLLFYAWGEGLYASLMLVSIGVNYVGGLLVDRLRERPSVRWVIGGVVAADLLLLAFFKYGNFIADNLSRPLVALGLPALDLAPVHLPIGISFFTFHALSYLIDVYRRDAPVQKNPFTMALYIALFPQLVAGPIVRYHHVAAQLVRRRVSGGDFAVGVKRFVIGLGKKVLIANTVASAADAIFGLPAGQLGTGVAWLGCLCYTLQIYFDFSGYSDMAIGLGRMFGFHFRENFRHPYASQSLREFWQRWHISLSTWFRDYLYIPLGGNRVAPWRTYLNLTLVFFLCGLWHGAAWNFVVWGLLHGALLVVERTGWGRRLKSLPSPLRHAYLLSFVMAGWVFFRAASLGEALQFLGAMLGLGGAGGPPAAAFANPMVLGAIAAGAVGATRLSRRLRARYRLARRTAAGARRTAGELLYHVGGAAALAAILLGAALNLSAGTYNPFIYFRF